MEMVLLAAEYRVSPLDSLLVNSGDGGGEEMPNDNLYRDTRRDIRRLSYLEDDAFRQRPAFVWGCSPDRGACVPLGLMRCSTPS